MGSFIVPVSVGGNDALADRVAPVCKVERPMAAVFSSRGNVIVTTAMLGVVGAAAPGYLCGGLRGRVSIASAMSGG